MSVLTTSMSPEDLLLEKIRDELLKHRGKENGIKSPEIAEIFGLSKEHSLVEPRTKIRKAIIKYILPIASDSHNGYYVIDNEEELKEFSKSIQSRIDKMNERLYTVILGYKHLKGDELEISTDLYSDDDEDLEEF